MVAGITIAGTTYAAPKLPGSPLHRVRSPQDVWARMAPHLSDYGITRVASLTGLDRVGIPVYSAIRPQGRTLSAGSGKGVTDAASRVSAVMEAAEQSVWESLDPEHVWASEDELSTAGRGFLSRSQVARDTGDLTTPAQVRPWVTGWDLLAEEEVLVPAECVEIWPPRPGNLLGPQSGSNGLASGTEVVEALASALYEVIERDAVACTIAEHGDSLATPRLDPTTSVSQDVADLVDRVRRAGLRLRLHDCTTDTGVPTAMAFLLDPERGGAGGGRGYGSHLDPDVAICRAVTEAAQARCLVLAGARDDLLELPRRAILHAAGSVGLDDRPGGEVSVLPASTAAEDLQTDCTTLLARLRGIGVHRVAVLLHSVPGDPAQVVRVVAEGLEGYRTPAVRPGARARAAAARRRRLRPTSGDGRP